MPRRSDTFPFGAGKDKFGLGFQITMTDGAAAHERASGSYTWAGINNTHFWVDRTTGVTGAIYTQTLPFVEPRAFGMYTDFETAVYASV